MRIEQVHPDVEFHVERAGTAEIYQSLDAAVEALPRDGSFQPYGTVDVVVWSEAGALWYGGDEAVDAYREDPEASIFERLSISEGGIMSRGRVP